MDKPGNGAKFEHLPVTCVILESICMSSFLELAPVLENILKAHPLCAVLLLAPYYLRQGILSRFSSFVMLAYKVAYCHTSVYPSRAETPVRIFTTIPLPKVPSPQEAGYLLCLQCNDWISYTTKHCSQCNRCTSADGEWCPHLRGPANLKAEVNLLRPRVPAEEEPKPLPPSTGHKRTPALAPARAAPAPAPAPAPAALVPAPAPAPAAAPVPAPAALVPAFAPASITLETPLFRSFEEEIKVIVASERELDADADSKIKAVAMFLMGDVRERTELASKYVVLLQ